MRKTIAKVSPMRHGHLMLEFEDGSKQTVFRGDHEQHAPAVGELWPPSGHEHVNDGPRSGGLRKV
jgi:hypothetical protein